MKGRVLALVLVMVNENFTAGYTPTRRSYINCVQHGRAYIAVLT